MSGTPIVMYIVVNKDLKMGKGKIAAQVGHVVGDIVRELEHMSPRSPKYIEYTRWITDHGYAKVVLQATQLEMERLIDSEATCRFVRDEGRTQIAPNSLTAIGFFPCANLATKLSSFKLL